ncbi:MAG: nitroreductase family protein [Oscillospiraceae bacterium]|jgi:nitroreductase|nr:nitroreductase family protein [Oscillospiraceae bacterium]
MENTVLKTIAQRRSIRSYKEISLTTEQIDILVKAALDAPTARNEQSWHFSIVTNKDLMSEINAETCKIIDREMDIFYNAPLAIFISGDINNEYSAIDAGIAVENIAIAAESIGLGSVILGLPGAAFKSEKASEFEKKLNFPETHKFQIAIAVGVPAASKDAHEVLPDRISYVK